MNNVQIIANEPGRFIVAGDLTFSSIGKKTAKSLSFLASAKDITIDLSQVGQTDSAGLALMLEWVKYARSKRCSIVFKNVPEQLRNLARLSGLETFAVPDTLTESNT